MPETKSGDQESEPIRLQSLDAYRGLIMISLAFVGFGLADTAGNFLQRSPDSDFWQGVKYQFSHTEWVGCSYWDLIQPSFMFMVGVSMPYSYSKRKRLGHSYRRMLGHAFSRSVILILLSIFLMSIWSRETSWGFMNVLAQIGLGYTFLFLLWDRPLVVQWLAAATILVGTWLAYEQYSGSGIDLDVGAPQIGVTQEWAETYLVGVSAPWHKNANIGQAIDLKFLNLFPRPEPFEFSSGGYQTINFIPSLATMLFGLMCGELLRSKRSYRFKLGWLIFGGLTGLTSGLFLGGNLVPGLEWCPIVKRIWTPAWALFSTGWCCLILSTLYGIIDVLHFRRWSFPLVVVGMNSIAMYCMSMTMKPWIARQWQTHFGNEVFTVYGTFDPAVEPTVQAILVGCVLWLVCYYLYRHRIFLRI